MQEMESVTTTTRSLSRQQRLAAATIDQDVEEFYTGRRFYTGQRFYTAGLSLLIFTR